jgi:RNA polymerase sigma-70 factor (ECF subfamily)
LKLLNIKEQLSEALLSGTGYQTVRMEIQERSAVPLAFNGQEETFEKLFKTHFKSLYAYALTIVKNEMVAEEMVQNVFFRIWEKKAGLHLQSPALAYLYKSVYHESLNYLKHQKVKAAYQAHSVYQMKNQTDQASKKILLSELEQQINKALSELPEQCRTIFQMSRFEELKYQEIADQLGLSIKTVENQMGKALKLMRLKLVDYLPFLIAFLIEP